MVLSFQVYWKELMVSNNFKNDNDILICKKLKEPIYPKSCSLNMQIW